MSRHRFQRSWGSAAVLAGICLQFAAAEAEACSPVVPEVFTTYPADGGLHPHNASILIAGSVIDPEGLAVTVDDQPATIIVEASSVAHAYFIWGSAYQHLVVSVEPRPAVGQHVRIFGETCPLEARDSDPCWNFDLAFEIEPPDLDAPTLEVDAWYDVYDHESIARDHGACSGWSAQYGIDLNVDVLQDVDAGPLLVEWYQRPRNEPNAWGRTGRGWRLEAGDPVYSTYARYLPEQVASLLPLRDALCFELRVSDLAGNLGTSVERCLPCRDQHGEPDRGFISDFPDYPPVYACGSITDDGYCPPSVLEACAEEAGSTSGGSEQPETSSGEDETTSSSSSSSSTSGFESDATSTHADADNDAPQDAPTTAALGDGCACSAMPDRRRAWLWMLLVGAGSVLLRRRAKLRSGPVRPV